MNIMNRKKRIVALVSAAVLAVATPSFTGLACDLSAHVQIVTKKDGLTIEARRSWSSSKDALLAWGERDHYYDYHWVWTRSQCLGRGLTRLRAGEHHGDIVANVVGAHNDDGWAQICHGKKPRNLGERAWNYLTLGDDCGVLDLKAGLPLSTDYHRLWAWDDRGDWWGVSAHGHLSEYHHSDQVDFHSGRLAVSVQGTKVRICWGGLVPALRHTENKRAVIVYVLKSGGGDVPLSLTRSDQEKRTPTLMTKAIETIELPPGDYEVVARGLTWEDRSEHWFAEKSEHWFTEKNGYATLTHPPEGGYRPSSAWEEERADGAQTVPLSSYSVVHIKVGKP